MEEGRAVELGAEADLAVEVGVEVDHVVEVGAVVDPGLSLFKNLL